ncbi:alkaline phosphatase D family protein [Effusibacillus lacus]|uniref:Alkaline phosphatase D n=1 Tax=Effusibacillus lacus TaxID=1348429 RepID=A0A292YRF9_9BACL|nr:alkaline phosphatase D family protein [Effusibacillus lacus]TCS75733.1 alkaline phosphatase D [Effusibacillus lacus]GAX91050.1 alkaline phosphatase D [Effusibacillus lacus]
MDSRRRLFLKSLLAGSAFFLVENFNSNGLVKITMAAGNGKTASVPVFTPSFTPGYGFPQSVASGDPTPTGAMIWTRVDPEMVQGISTNQFDSGLIQWLENPNRSRVNSSVAEAIANGQFVMFEVSAAENFSSVALRGYAPIYKDFDNVVKVDLDGRLLHESVYYYRFITRFGHVTKTGKFKTLAESNSTPDNCRFAFVSCADYTNGYYNAYRFLAEESLDFVVHLGDYIYESVGDPNYQNPLPDRQIKLPGNTSKAFTLEDYRTLYRTYRSDPDLQKLHETHAVIAIWDDHEFANDTYYPAVAPDDSPESNPSRRLTANQVWFEYMPARLIFDASKGFKDSLKIYRAIRIGNLAELILTDERLYRSAHPCGEGLLGERYLADGCEKMNDPSQSMLGVATSGQRDWFLNRVQNSTAIWKIWGNEVQYTPLKLFGKYLNLDAWDGFAGERKIITQELKNAGVRNFLVITGDLHTYEANLVKVDYEQDPDHAAVGVEFMVGSVTSSNLKELVEQAVYGRVSGSNPIPLPVLQEILNQITGPVLNTSDVVVSEAIKKLSTLVLLENPWIKLFDSTTHGYCVMELAMNKAVCTAYSVDTVKSREAKKYLLWECEVPSGQASLNIVTR